MKTIKKILEECKKTEDFVKCVVDLRELKKQDEKFFYLEIFKEDVGILLEENKFKLATGIWRELGL